MEWCCAHDVLDVCVDPFVVGCAGDVFYFHGGLVADHLCYGDVEEGGGEDEQQEGKHTIERGEQQEEDVVRSLHMMSLTQAPRHPLAVPYLAIQQIEVVQNRSSNIELVQNKVFVVALPNTVVNPIAVVVKLQHTPFAL